MDQSDFFGASGLPSANPSHAVQCGDSPGFKRCSPLCHGPMMKVWPATGHSKNSLHSRANRWPASAPIVSHVRNHQSESGCIRSLIAKRRLSRDFNESKFKVSRATMALPHFPCPQNWISSISWSPKLPSQASAESQSWAAKLASRRPRAL